MLKTFFEWKYKNRSVESNGTVASIAEVYLKVKVVFRDGFIELLRVHDNGFMEIGEGGGKSNNRGPVTTSILQLHHPNNVFIITTTSNNKTSTVTIENCQIPKIFYSSSVKT